MTISASHHLLDQAMLIKQGAEAKVYSLDSLLPQPTIYWPPSGPSKPSSTAQIQQTTAPKCSVILKYRFKKQYRHPALDLSLTRSRLAFEARALARCTRAGVVVPHVMWVDDRNGVIGMERIDGWSVREVLGGGAEGEMTVEEEDEEEIGEMEMERSKDQVDSINADETESEGWTALRSKGVTKEHLMTSIGRAIAKLHGTAIIHGDLTTSNMMVRFTPNGSEPYEIVLIDFGLSSTATLPEHYAVDLYVLERAFASTHPQSEGLYAGVLAAYAEGLGEKKWRPIQTKLKEVRLRGRKRDMTG
ncbi:Serine/threonine-protein kinase BUD32 [Kockovaella imperatae]|uniref:EKC/KEOPS complex subunit BUD32 n=1 Tax=Kockovaella imperatae TaxID=4999 RepID=A0A1Y1U9C7_9TREE|nr:Serine/threonine-protein kinase BUD32 [Kockovaella imperatae]ORX34633.1 Serine/threonine-protein kinase BUD32 [Kockovaella imperatae]